MSVRPEVVIIAATDRNGGIGIDNTLPWRLRADLLRFKATTMGYPIAMGRKTWQSLGRPLPGRRNIVISRNPDFSAPGAEVTASIETAIELAEDAGRIFIIGGEQIYAGAMPLCDRLLVTEVDAEVRADAHFPAWSRADFQEVSRESHVADADNDHDFDFVEYRRIRPA